MCLLGSCVFCVGFSLLRHWRSVKDELDTENVELPAGCRSKFMDFLACGCEDFSPVLHHEIHENAPEPFIVQVQMFKP